METEPLNKVRTEKEERCVCVCALYFVYTQGDQKLFPKIPPFLV